MFLSASKASGLLLLWALWPLLTAAQTHPDSVCSLREQRVFAGSFEELSSIAPIGLENCANLDRLFDADLTDTTPLQVALDVDETYQFATLTTLDGEYVHGDYTVSGLPAFAGFDEELGVSDLSPGAGDVGAYLVEYNVAPGGLPGALDPLFVEFVVGVAGSLEIFGLDFECDGSLTSWPYHGNWFDSDDDGVIDQPWAVYEDKTFAAPACVMTDKSSITLSERGTYELPSYAELVGGRIEMHPADGLAGESGTLELLITDNDTGTTRALDVPYQVVPKQPNIVGLSDTQQNGTIDNPVLGSRFQYDVEVPCTADADRRYIVTEFYDPDMQYQAVNLPTDIMGLNQSTGSIFSNPSCPGDIGRTEAVSVRAQNNSAASLYKTADYVFTNGVDPIVIDGIGVLDSDEVTLTGRFDYTLDTATNTINRPVSVRASYWTYMDASQ